MLQLELPLQPEPGGPDALLERLRGYGLTTLSSVTLHENRSVMVSLGPQGRLRLHRGYAWAPDEVLAAVARFLRRGTRRSERLAARAMLLAFPAERFAPSRRPMVRRPEPVRPGDDRILARLRSLHDQLNAEYFGGRLAPIPIRLSGRMRRRLGELRVDRATGSAEEIGIARRHLRRDGWDAVRDTLLHEMVHQWQAESSKPVDHGPEFRRMARAVGVEPRAMKVDG
jgi:hypothetical protein